MLTTPNIKTAQNIVTQLKDYFVNELEHLNIDKNQKLYELKQEFKKKCEKIKKIYEELESHIRVFEAIVVQLKRMRKGLRR